MNSLIEMVARAKFGNSILEIINGLNERLIGNRSEILVVLIIAIAILEHTNIIPSKTAEPIITALTGALPVTLAEKISNYKATAEKILPPMQP